MSKRSGYRTDGTPHHEGVHNEHVMCEWLSKNLPECMTAHYKTTDLRFEHRGGTHGVADAVVCCGSDIVGDISIKQNKSGTFDHINTPIRDELFPNTDALKASVNEIKHRYARNIDAVASARRELNDVFNTALGTIQDSHIRALLHQIAARSAKWMLVNRNGDIHVFSHNKLAEIAHYPNDPDTTYELRNAKNAKESRQIWRVTNGVAVNTHLRMRLTTNNGVKVLLGITEKKSTAIVIKIQQDNVPELLRSVRG